MKRILFFPNGNTAVFIDNEQQPELQQPWVVKFAEFLERQGYDPAEFELTMPNSMPMRLFRLEDGGWNWRAA